MTVGSGESGRMTTVNEECLPNMSVVTDIAASSESIKVSNYNRDNKPFKLTIQVLHTS